MPGEHITQEEADEFALGVTDAERAREIARHIAACDECQEKVDAADELTSHLALSAPHERPSERMRERIFEAAGIDRPSPLVRLARLSGAIATVAALTVAGIALVAVISLDNSVDELRGENADLERQVEDALSQRVEIAVLSQELETTSQRVDDLLERAQADRELQLALLSPRSKQALVSSPETPADSDSGPIGRFIWDPDQSRFWFMAEGLAPQPPGKTYELFAGTIDGNYVSLGTFNAESDGFVLYGADVPSGLDGYTQAVVTIEDQYGDRERYGPTVFVLDFTEQDFR